MKKVEERVVEQFPRRCPYCDGILLVDPLELKTGENEIACPSCNLIFINVVTDPCGKE